MSVAVDDTDPRDPCALCDRCGAQGTVARAVRSGPTRLVLRYCGQCWPVVQHEIEGRQREENERWIEADRTWFEQWERSPPGAAPSPPNPPVWSMSSRSWYDVRGFLALIAEVNSGSGPTSAQFAEIAAEIRDTADEMDGPIPPDIEDFLARHTPPSA